MRENHMKVITQLSTPNHQQEAADQTERSFEIVKSKCRYNQRKFYRQIDLKWEGPCTSQPLFQNWPSPGGSILQISLFYLRSLHDIVIAK